MGERGISVSYGNRSSLKAKNYNSSIRLPNALKAPWKNFMFDNHIKYFSYFDQLMQTPPSGMGMALGQPDQTCLGGWWATAWSSMMRQQPIWWEAALILPQPCTSFSTCLIGKRRIGLDWPTWRSLDVVSLVAFTRCVNNINPKVKRNLSHLLRCKFLLSRL